MAHLTRYACPCDVLPFECMDRHINRQYTTLKSTSVCVLEEIGRLIEISGNIGTSQLKAVALFEIC